MSVIYTALAFLEIFALFASFAALVFFVVRAIIRLFMAPKDPPRPKPEDMRHLKRAGQSGFY